MLLIQKHINLVIIDYSPVTLSMVFTDRKCSFKDIKNVLIKITATFYELIFVSLTLSRRVKFGFPKF